MPENNWWDIRKAEIEIIKIEVEGYKADNSYAAQINSGIPYIDVDFERKANEIQEIVNVMQDRLRNGY